MTVERKLEETFCTLFGREPAIVVRAPGRVNLIGEHTDYNQGFVFPAALECEVRIAAALRTDQRVVLYSASFQQEDRFPLTSIQPSDTAPWSNYVRGVVREFQKLGHPLSGFDAVISGDVPIGSGLSSSAALEVAAAMLLNELWHCIISKPEMAMLCQRAEHNFVGVQCGIMDQLISLLGKKDRALLIVCRDLTYREVPFQLDEYTMVICDSRASRELAGSAYNQRLEECRQGVAHLSRYYPGINSLRDVSWEQFAAVEPKLPDIIRKRCRHVITENARTLQAAEYLGTGQLQAFGKLMTDSHASLRDDYEVSSWYLDILVQAAMEGQECLGARLTGAGFGGCTVNIVRTRGLPVFKERVSFIYREQTGKAPVLYSSLACDGASVLHNYRL